MVFSPNICGAGLAGERVPLLCSWRFEINDIGKGYMLFFLSRKFAKHFTHTILYSRGTAILSRHLIIGRIMCIFSVKSQLFDF